MIAAFLALSLATAADPGATPNPTPPAPAAVPLNDEVLQATRGGSAPATLPGLPNVTDSALSLQSVNGQVLGDSVTANTVNSGPISFNGDALSGFSGVGNILLNTGINSLLQGSISLTVNLVGTN